MSDLRHDAESSPAYVLGHSHHELERLKAQARLIDPITQRFFREAGIGPGMRALVERMRSDVIANSSVIVGHSQIGAWSRI